MQYIFFVVAVILLLVIVGILGFVYIDKIVRFESDVKTHNILVYLTI